MANNQVKITGSAEMTIQRSKLLATELIQFLERVPPEAEIHINYHAGDQRDPGYTTLKATWAL